MSVQQLNRVDHPWAYTHYHQQYDRALRDFDWEKLNPTVEVNHQLNHYIKVYSPPPPSTIQRIINMFNKKPNEDLLRECDHLGKQLRQLQRAETERMGQAAKERRLAAHKEIEDKFKAVYDIGDTFEYCGRELIVCKIDTGCVMRSARMVCEYSNEAGDIKEHNFYIADIPLLEKL